MSSKSDSKKRKRDDSAPDALVFFTTSQGVTFRRVLRDQSFDDVKAQVRQKLGLSANEKFTLVELKGGEEILLNDDYDFDAFRYQAHSCTEFRVLVRVGDGSHDPPAVQTPAAYAPAPAAASMSTTGQDQRSSTAATKSKPKSTATGLKHNPLARLANAATGQSITDTVFPAQPIAGPSSRPVAAPDVSPPDAPPSSFPKKQTAKKTTGSAARAIHSPQTTMQPPPVPPTAADDLAAKKRRKKTKRPSDTLPSPTPEPSSSVPSAQPTPTSLPEKRKAEATQSGAESSPEGPPKKKTKKKVTIEATSESSNPVKPAAKKKGQSKDPIDDVSTEAGPPSKKKGKGKEVEETDGKKKKKGAKENGKAAMTAEEKRALMDTIRGVAMRGAAPRPPSPSLAEPSVTPEAGPDRNTVRDTSKAKSRKASGSVTQAVSTSTENQTVGPSATPAAIEPSQPKAKVKAKSGKSSVAAAQDLANALDKAYAAPPEPRSTSSPEVPKKKAATKKGSRAMETPCPVCLNTPFHLRNQCPVIVEGSRSIEARIEELRKQGQHDDLVEDLEEHLEKARQKEGKAAPSKPSQSTTSKATAKPANIVLPPITQPIASEVSTPVSAVIPAGSAISTVAVQGKDDGSSSDSSSSDDESEDARHVAKKSNVRTPSLVISSSLSVNKSEADIEALLRGPVSRKRIVDQIPSNSGSEEDEEEDEDEEASDEEGLASDREEQEDKAFRRLSRQLEKRGTAESSDDESVDDSEKPPAETDLVELPASIPQVANSRPNIASSSSSESVLNQIVLDDSAEPEDGADAADAAGGSRGSTPPPSVLDGQDDVVPESDPAQSEGEDENEPSNSHTDEAQGDNTVVVPSSPICLQPEPSLEIPLLYDDPVPEDPAAAKDSGSKNADHQNSSPVPDNLTIRQARRTSHEDPQDPIEPAEDLDNDIPKPDTDDPIEFDPPVDSQQSTPPLTPFKSVSAKRMKDRHGQLDSPKVLPVLASQLRKAGASQNGPLVSGEISDPAEASGEQEPSNDSDGPRRSLRPRKATPDVPIASQGAAPGASEPQKGSRGRPKLSQEEKDRRAAARKAETAARRQALKELQREEREAEKERKAAERKAKAEEKARLKANGVTVRARKVPRKNATPEPPESEEEDVLSARPNGSPPDTPLPSEPAALKRIPASMAKWEILTEVDASPSTFGGDMTMIDELRSSSPDLGVNGRRVDRRGTKSDEDQEIPDSQESAPKAQASRPPSTSLFFPSDTQLPDSQPETQNPFEYSFTTSSQSRKKSGSQDMSSKFKKPASAWQKNLLPTPTNLARRTAAPFKRLSDIMSSQDVLSLSQSTPTPATNAARRQALAAVEDRRESMYGSLGNDPSDSEDDSDSDEANTSHIPKSRRAGQKSRKELFVN